jgi:hypothetical protein
VLLPLSKGKVDKTNQHVAKVEVLEFIVQRYLKLADEFQQAVFQLVLEKETVLYVVILLTSVVFLVAPLSRESQ